MNNKIVYIATDEVKKIRTDALNDQDVFLAEIDGARIRTEEEYVRAMIDAFAIPHPLLGMKIGILNDWIEDLTWIKQKDIVFIIHDFDSMLLDDLKAKKIIMLDFEEIILPWWDGDVVGHMVGGQPRGFRVYLERLKMYRKLNEKELQWIDRLMDVEFQGRDILLQQLSKAKIIYTQGDAFISIKFKVEGDIELYPYHVRVPVAMRAFQQSSAPIIFLLHIVNGIIDELEILTADLSQIDIDNIEIERVEYEVNQEVTMQK